MRIAMWSGPRNLSTAMMYSFGARSDCAAVDEPFYAAYLALTGLDHPMRDAVLASQDQDPQAVAQDLLAAKDQPVFYQKHMTQHMLPEVPRAWMADVRNVFLIRHPARVIASFGAKWDGFGLSDIGFTQQTELFDHVKSLGQTPVVIDSADIRKDPEGMLRKLCTTLGLEFQTNMLNWPKGGHKDDGVWAAHWYGAVHGSTGFAAAEGPLPSLDEKGQILLEQALPHYDRLAAEKL